MDFEILDVVSSRKAKKFNKVSAPFSGKIYTCDLCEVIERMFRHICFIFVKIYVTFSHFYVQYMCFEKRKIIT